jgi:hypothetical protein
MRHRASPGVSLASLDPSGELGVAGAADLLRAVVEELDPAPIEAEAPATR